MKKLFLLLIFAGTCVFGQLGQLDQKSNEEIAFSKPIADSIFVDKTAVKAGDTFSVLLELHVAENWKVYWKTSGGITMPMEFKWTLPAGVTHEGTIFPYPKRDYTKESGVSYSNHGKVIYQANSPKKSYGCAQSSFMRIKM